MRGLDGRNSTPMGSLTGSGAIFTRGLGAGGLTCFQTKRYLNGARVQFLSFVFRLIFEMLKNDELPSLILTCQKLIHRRKY